MTRDNYDVFFICKLNQVKQFNDFVLSFCVCIQKKKTTTTITTTRNLAMNLHKLDFFVYRIECHFFPDSLTQSKTA